MKKTMIGGKDKKQYLEKAKILVQDPSRYFHKKSILQLYETESGSALVFEERPIFILMGANMIPTLHLIRSSGSLLPKITVDKGAINFVVKGADIMRPGITHIEDGIAEGDLVLIVEETNGAPLAVGSAKYDGRDMKEMDKGKVVKNLHHLKDYWWNFTG